MELATLSPGPSAHRRLALHHELVGATDSDTPPLLMLHGFGANTYTWRHLVPALGRCHRLILVDLKGFGQSPKPLDRAYSPFNQADLVLDLLRGLALASVTIVGHSFGGGIALALALQLRERASTRLERLVLLDAISYRQRLPAFIRFLRMPIAGEVGTRLVPAELQVRCVLDQSYHDRTRITADSIEAYARPLRMPGGRHAMIETARHIEPPDVDTWSGRFREIQVPTLVIWGDDDRIVPIANGQRLSREVPDAVLRTITGCGHIPQEEQPQATLAAMEAFLGDALPTDPR